MINGRTGINGDANPPNKQTKIKIINKAKSLSFERKKWNGGKTFEENKKVLKK